MASHSSLSEGPCGPQGPFSCDPSLSSDQPQLYGWGGGTLLPRQAGQECPAHSATGQLGPTTRPEVQPTWHQPAVFTLAALLLIVFGRDVIITDSVGSDFLCFWT